MTRTGLSPLVLAAALLALAGCGDGVTVDPGPEYPARGAAVSGDLQRDTVTDELPAALVVRVTDQGGDPLPGQTVTWSVTAGGGTLFAATSQTNAAGEASNRWTLGTVAGDTQRVEARMVDPGSGAPVVLATFRATGLADVPAAVAARAPAARAGSAGQAVADSLEALVTDAHGNPVAGAPVVWTVPAGGGSVSPGTTTTGADGVARTQWTLGLDLGAQQTAEAAISPAVRATFTATAGLPVAATLAKVSGDAQNGTVGTAPAQPLTVELRTSLGQPIAGAQVTWTAAAFSGTVTPPVSVTGADGRASTTWTLFTRPGMQQVTARVQGAADAVFTATAAPGPAASVTVVPGTLALTALGDTARLAATALDEYGNGAVEPLQWISRDPAVATVDAAGLVTGRANGGSWIVGTAGTRADSARVTVTQQAVRLDLTPRADTLNALGDTIAFTARALDRNDQPVSGVALTWTASNPLRMIRPGVFVSRTNGLATVTVSGGGFTQTATVLNRQVPATITLRSGTLIVNDTVPLNPARARQLAIVEEVADSNAVRVDVSARPAATITPAGAIAAGSQAVIAAAPGGGTATVQIGAATGTAQFDVVAFDSVAAGDDHGCGLTTGGDVYCWGAGFNQPLPSPAGRPRKVNLPGRATAITSDCALLQNGTVYCGLAGTPAPWTGVPAMASLTEGCALTASGTAYCQDADRVVRPLAGYTFVQVSQRSEAPNGPPLERCGLQANGQVVCWTPGGTPAPLAGGHTFRRIDLGRWMSCGITTDGRLLCWGYLYGDGAPVLVSASLGLVTLEVEYANACGLRADGALFCWGSDGVIEWDPGVAVAPAPKWPTLRFTDYSVGLVGFTSTTGMAALECGVADGTLWCSGGDLRSNVGRTGGPGLAGRVMSPF